MNETPNEILKNQFVKLPKSIQNLILSTEFQNSLNTISTVNNLGEEKRAALENESVLILMGLESTGDYQTNLVSEVGLTQEQAQGVEKEVLEKIITPVADSLRTFLEKELEDEKQETAMQTKEGTHVISSIKPTTQTDSFKKEATSTNAEEIKKALRENTKTISVKNLIANIE